MRIWTTFPLNEIPNLFHCGLFKMCGETSYIDWPAPISTEIGQLVLEIDIYYFVKEQCYYISR